MKLLGSEFWSVQLARRAAEHQLGFYRRMLASKPKSTIDWPDLVLPPINLWNVPKLDSKEKDGHDDRSPVQ